jgi:uncharacterized protein
MEAEVTAPAAGDATATAREVAGLARDGRFAEVEERYAPGLRAVVGPGMLRAAWEAEVGQRGRVLAVGDPQLGSVPATTGSARAATQPAGTAAQPAEATTQSAESAGAGLVRVTVPVSCERGGLTLVMSVDEIGRLHGLRIGPAAGGEWTPPDYAVPRRFTEREVTIGTGPDAVPGTLSLPRRRGVAAWRRGRGYPGVVLLSGGGAFDRDGTSGANKPLKDLAWGLASRGVAVLRFDKVTFAHPDLVAAAGDFTVSAEYVPHAVAAVGLLRQQPEVDPGRVFVLGHSLGGRVAPRVAAADGSVAGLVLLAGDAEPVADKAVRVARYIAEAEPGPAAEAFAETMAGQAALADGPDLTAATPAADLPFGWPGSYWLDLRAYDPVATAAGLGRPMLILQGGRDYQVTVAEDLARWRAGLGDRGDVTFRVYEADNHLFFSGSGRSVPAQYDPPQHVDGAVVADIAGWLAATGR